MERGRGLPSQADTGHADGQDALATLLSSFARTVQQRHDFEGTLSEIVRGAIALVPGCDKASISVVLARRRVTSQASSGTMPEIVDALQEKFRQGPCMDAAYEHETVRVPDMATEIRWPLFTAAALAAGAAGMMALQLYVEGDDLGALNLFSRKANAFDDESEHVALLFAAHAAVAFAGSAREASLTRTVATRQLIGQAQGILMERHRVTDDQAFALLVRASQHTNAKLRDVSARLVRSGSLDGQAREGPMAPSRNETEPIH